MALLRLKYDLFKLGLGMETGDYIKLGEKSGKDLALARIDGLSDTDANTTLAKGSLAMDTTNGKLFVHSGTDWKIVTSS